MKKIARIIWFWGPVIGWMSFIFFLSSRQSISVSQTYLYNFILFKTLHMIEYAFLYLLVFRAVNSIDAKHFSLHKKLITAFIITFVYAVTDEFHQTFIPTRTGQIRDIFIDLAGILLMYIYIKSHKNIIKLLI